MYKSLTKSFALSACIFLCVVLFSCSADYSLDGKWKFPDDSTIQFSTKRGPILHAETILPARVIFRSSLPAYWRQMTEAVFQ